MKEGLWLTLVTCLAYLVPICRHSSSAALEALMCLKLTLFASVRALQPGYNCDVPYLPFWKDLLFHNSCTGRTLWQPRGTYTVFNDRSETNRADTVSCANPRPRPRFRRPAAATLGCANPQPPRLHRPETAVGPAAQILHVVDRPTPACRATVPEITRRIATTILLRCLRTAPYLIPSDRNSRAPLR